MTIGLAYLARTNHVLRTRILTFATSSPSILGAVICAQQKCYSLLPEGSDLSKWFLIELVTNLLYRH